MNHGSLLLLLAHVARSWRLDRSESTTSNLLVHAAIDDPTSRVWRQYMHLLLLSVSLLLLLILGWLLHSRVPIL